MAATAKRPWRELSEVTACEPALEQDGQALRDVGCGCSPGSAPSAAQEPCGCGGPCCIGGDSKVLLGALSPPVDEAVRHLQWSKLPSAVFACLATRDASSLCHSP